MHLANVSPAWFALYVKRGCEKSTAQLLRQKGYEDFLPLRTVRKRWSDRFKELHIPLFPGYMFCLFNPEIGSPIITTPGVIRIIGIGKTPIAVSDEEIEAVKTLVRSGLCTQPWPYLQEGQRVRVEFGPLRGVQGIVLKVKNQHRLIISVSLLQRSVSVEINQSWISPIDPQDKQQAFEQPYLRHAAAARH